MYVVAVRVVCSSIVRLTGRRVLPAIPIEFLSVRRVPEGPGAEVRRGARGQVSHQREEGGSRGGSVRPALSHEGVEPVGTVLRTLHHAALHYVTEHLNQLNTHVISEYFTADQRDNQYYPCKM